jgi:hypothetical protein
MKQFKFYTLGSWLMFRLCVAIALHIAAGLLCKLMVECIMRDIPHNGLGWFQIKVSELGDWVHPSDKIVMEHFAALAE